MAEQPVTTSDAFEPSRIFLVDTPHGPGLAVENEANQQVGILVSDAARRVLSEFLATSGPRFLDIWKNYDQRPGGEVFLWDLAHLADLIGTSPDKPWLRRLARIRDGNEAFHNVVQAQIMAEADALYPGAVRLGRPHPSSRTPDFFVDRPSETDFELESIPRLFCLELVDDGMRLSPRNTHLLRRTLITRATKGFTQVGPNGTVIIAIWCDHLGALVEHNAEMMQLAVPLRALLTPGKLGICFRPSQGRLLSFVFDREGWELGVRQLCEQFSIPVTASLSFSGGGADGAGPVSFFRGSGRISVGRRLCIADIQGAYTNDEIAATFPTSPLSSLATNELTQAIEFTDRVHAILIAADDSMRHNPLERRNYSLQELGADQRAKDLLSATHQLSLLVSALPLELAAEMNVGRISADLQRFGPLAARFLEVHSGRAPGWVAAMELLTAKKPFCLARRIGHLYSTLLRQEHESRMQQKVR